MRIDAEQRAGIAAQNGRTIDFAQCGSRREKTVGIFVAHVKRIVASHNELRGADDLNEMYDFLVNADVVEGPPALREIVAELWPELLHKVKPPISEMH